MHRRLLTLWTAAILLVTAATSVRAADNRIATAVNDPSRIAAMMAGMTDDQALKFASELIAAANQLPLSVTEKADRIARIAAALVTTCRSDNVGRMASLVVGDVGQEYVAKATTAIALAITLRQERATAAAPAAGPIAVARAGGSASGDFGSELGSDLDRTKARTLSTGTKKAATESTPLTSAAPAGSARTSSGGTPAPLTPSWIVIPPDGVSTNRGTDGDGSTTTTPPTPTHPTPPAPAPYYDGQ